MNQLPTILEGVNHLSIYGCVSGNRAIHETEAKSGGKGSVDNFDSGHGCPIKDVTDVFLLGEEHAIDKPLEQSVHDVVVVVHARESAKGTLALRGALLAGDRWLRMSTCIVP